MGILNIPWQSHQDNDRHNIILNGVYAIYIEHWFKIFHRDQILIINGQDLQTQPAAIIEKVQKFIGVKKYLTEKDFIYEEDKGFYCVKTDDIQAAKCLANTKVGTITWNFFKSRIFKLN